MHTDQPEDRELDREPPSKSARKRAHKELQELADELMKLSASQLARIPLGDDCFATPAVANGAIYFRTATQLMSLGGETKR